MLMMHFINHSRTNHLPAAALLMLLACAALFSGGRHAAAQTTAIGSEETYIGVVTGDDVYIRSGPAGESYYPFGKVHAGDLVKVVGEKYNWARVAAAGPAFRNLFGYIKYPANEQGRFRLEGESGTGTALGQIDVIAPNLDAGQRARDSWKPLLRLSSGDKVQVITTETTDNEIIHKVALPEAAHGWINMAYVRKATEQEQATWQAQLVGAGAPQGRAAQPTRDETRPNTSAAAPMRSTRNEASGAARDATTPAPGGSEAANRNRTGAGSQPGIGVLAAVEPAPYRVVTNPLPPLAREEPTIKIGSNQPAGVDRGVAGRTAEAADELKKLDAVLERMKEQADTSEVQALREMYLELAKLNADEKRIVHYAETRATQLEIWQEIQSEKHALQELETRTDAADQDVQTVRLALRTAGAYSAVGRLVTSTIYDGRELPKLFRVQDPASGRTVAYIERTDEFDLVGMLGQLVGVKGEKRFDPALRLNIITPEHFDILAPNRPVMEVIGD